MRDAQKHASTTHLQDFGVFPDLTIGLIEVHSIREHELKVYPSFHCVGILVRIEFVKDSVD